MLRFSSEFLRLKTRFLRLIHSFSNTLLLLVRTPFVSTLVRHRQQVSSTRVFLCTHWLYPVRLMVYARRLKLPRVSRAMIETTRASPYPAQRTLPHRAPDPSTPSIPDILLLSQRGTRPRVNIDRSSLTSCPCRGSETTSFD